MVILPSDSGADLPSSLPQRRGAGRPPKRREELKKLIRDSLMSMDYRPGDQIPSRPKLREMTGISGNSVQAAIDDLVREGFLIVRPGQGTYVRDKPPHLNRYAVVYPDMANTLYLHTFHHVVSQYPVEDGREFVFCNNDYLISRDDQIGQLEELYEEARRGLVAGVILPRAIPSVLDHPVWAEAGVPVVVTDVQAKPGQQTPLITIHMDHQARMEQAYQILVDQGCQRLGVIDNISMAYHGDEYVTMAKQYGLACSRKMVLGTTYSHASWGVAAIKLLMSLPADERPDGLFVADDNLTGCANEALRSLPPEQYPTVVAHANFPLLAPNPRHWHRVGYDLNDLLIMAADAIDQWREGIRRDEPLVLSAQTLDSTPA